MKKVNEITSMVRGALERREKGVINRFLDGMYHSSGRGVDGRC
jgi:hypothetical protein